MVKRLRSELEEPHGPAPEAAETTSQLIRTFIDALGMSLADAMRLSMEAQMVLLNRRLVRTAGARCMARFIEPRVHMDGSPRLYMWTTLTDIVRKACHPMAWFSDWKGHECNEYNAAFDLLSLFLDLCASSSRTKQQIALFTDLCEAHAGLCATARVCVETSKLRMLFYYEMMCFVRERKIDTTTLATDYWGHYSQYHRRMEGLISSKAVTEALLESRLKADAKDRTPAFMNPESTRHALLLDSLFQEAPPEKGMWMRGFWCKLEAELSAARSFSITYNLLLSTQQRLLTVARLIGGDAADAIRYLFGSPIGASLAPSNVRFGSAGPACRSA
jgi:hypothetical protein